MTLNKLIRRFETDEARVRLIVGPNADLDAELDGWLLNVVYTVLLLDTLNDYTGDDIWRDVIADHLDVKEKDPRNGTYFHTCTGEFMVHTSDRGWVAPNLQDKLEAGR